MFEELVMDVYDEIDRRETEASKYYGLLFYDNIYFAKKNVQKLFYVNLQFNAIFYFLEKNVSIFNLHLKISGNY